MISISNHVVNEATVTKDDIVALTAVNGVAVYTAEDPVVSIIRRDGVVVTDERIHGEDLDRIPDHNTFTGHAIGYVTQSAVTQDRDQCAAVVEVVHPPTVTEDDVICGAAGDVIFALTAEDDQWQGRSCAPHRVVVVNGQEVVVRALGVQDKEAIIRCHV